MKPLLIGLFLIILILAILLLLCRQNAKSKPWPFAAGNSNDSGDPLIRQLLQMPRELQEKVMLDMELLSFV